MTAEQITTAGRTRATNRRGVRTRDSLLDAAEERFSRLTLGELFAGLSASGVSEQAGLPTQSAFFHHFGNQERWAAEVARHFTRSGAVDDEIVAVTEQIGVLAGELRAGEPTDWLAGIRAAADLDWKILSSDLGNFEQQLLVWIGRERALILEAGSTGTAGDLVAELYGSIQDRFEPVYAELLAAWGRKMRPDLTVGDLAVALTALVEGLILRSAVDPDAVPDDLFGRLVASLVPVLSVEAGNVTATDEHLARIGATPRPTSSPDRDLILGAAATLLQQRSWSQISVQDIAGAAGVAPSAVYDQFGTKEAVGALLWRRHHLALVAYVAELQDPAIPHEPLEVVRLVLDRLVALARHDREITAALFSAVTAETARGAEAPFPTDVRREIPLPDALLPVVERAQQAGQLRKDLPAGQVAASLTNFTLVHAMTRPNLPAHKITAYVFDLLVNGLANR